MRPRIELVVLKNLLPSDGIGLRAHQNYEGTKFDDVNVDGADLAGTVFSECELVDVSAHETSFRAARFVETAVDRLTAPVFRAPNAHFRDVRIQSSRLGSVELYASELQSVHFVACKLGYLNLRGAQLRDVLFTECSIEELDLGGADVARLAFKDTSVNALDVTGATLAHVDLRSLALKKLVGIEGLRGATLTEAQVEQLAMLIALQLGIKVEAPPL